MEFYAFLKKEWGRPLGRFWIFSIIYWKMWKQGAEQHVATCEKKCMYMLAHEYDISGSICKRLES